MRIYFIGKITKIKDCPDNRTVFLFFTKILKKKSQLLKRCKKIFFENIIRIKKLLLLPHDKNFGKQIE